MPKNLTQNGREILEKNEDKIQRKQEKSTKKW